MLIDVYLSLIGKFRRRYNIIQIDKSVYTLKYTCIQVLWGLLFILNQDCIEIYPLVTLIWRISNYILLRCSRKPSFFLGNEVCLPPLQFFWFRDMILVWLKSRVLESLKNMKISLRTKLIIGSVAVITICGLVATLMGIHLIGTGIVNQAQDKVRIDLNSASHLYQDEIQKLKLWFLLLLKDSL